MKQEPLVWKHFDQLVLHDLENAKNAKQKRQIIKLALGLEKRDWNNKEEKTEIILDAFTNCYNYARRHEFTNQSISVLMAILNQVHEYACQTSFENTQESLHFSRELILFHSVLRPPFSIEVFTPNEAKLANQYMDENYFRHFKLYKYVFTPRIVMDLNFQYPNQPEPVEEVNQAEDELTDENGEDPKSNEEKSNEDEIEEVIKNVLNTNLSKLMENFQSQLKETTQNVKKTLTEITPSSAQAKGKPKSPKDSKKK